MKSFRLYEEVNKNYKQFYEKLDMSFKYLVDKYYKYFDENKKEKLFILNDLSTDLEKVSNLFDNYGYTYFPSNVEDISEDSFEDVIMRYLDTFKKFVDEGNIAIETLNVYVKTLMVLVDKHKSINEHFE